MDTDKVIYTNGRDVVVTESAFQVKNTMYRLNGITKHSLSVLRAPRLPGIVLCLLGAGLLLLGIFDVLPQADSTPDNSSLSANTLSILIGAGLVLIGFIILVLVKDRYAVRIATAEGEKNVVISNKKEYIAQIVDALNEASKRIGFDSHYVAS